MAFDPVFVYGNYAEASVWTVMGAVALAKRPNRFAVMLGLTLIAFGVSDVVEAGTGAWYDPWWLLAWKAACVAGIIAFGVAARRHHRRRSGPGSQNLSTPKDATARAVDRA